MNITIIDTGNEVFRLNVVADNIRRLEESAR
jgi:hypothetical protein